LKPKATITITSATVISLVISLTLSPAMCALLLKPHTDDHGVAWYAKPMRIFFGGFNRGFEALAKGYNAVAKRIVRFAVMMLVVYAGILAFGLNEFRTTPQGFIPQIDRGILIVAAQLPPGSALKRTDDVMRKATEMVLSTPGVAHSVVIVGFSGASFSSQVSKS